MCRVCGRLLFTKSVKTKYLCKEFLEQLHTVFGISAESDDTTIHPIHFCHACKVVIHKFSSSYQHRTAVFEDWCSHLDDSCAVCQHFNLILRGGRPKKAKRTPGRPPTISTRYCIERIREVAPPPLIPPHQPISVCEVHVHLPLSELNCPICCDLLNQPVELVTCRSTVCAECLCTWVQYNQFVCPCCYDNHLKDFSTIKQAAPLVVTSTGSLCVVCGKCKNHMQLSTYKDHHCRPLTPVVSPNTSVEDILHQPLSAPLTPIEQKLQTRLARRSLTEESVLQLKTGGKVKHNAAHLKFNLGFLLPATDLCPSETGSSSHRRGSSQNHQATLPVSSKCSSGYVRRLHHPASP